MSCLFLVFTKQSKKVIKKKRRKERREGGGGGRERRWKRKIYFEAVLVVFCYKSKIKTLHADCKYKPVNLRL